MGTDRGHDQAALHTMTAVMVGMAVAYATLPVGFVAGTSGYWTSTGPEGIDGLAALTGLRYFLADHWRFPLLDVPGFGAPGTNIAYTDSIPALALALKALGVRDINPYGWWVALSFVLTPLTAVRLARLLGVRTLAGVAGVAVFAATLPILTLRVMHATLTAHWIVLLAMECYFRRASGRPWPWLEALLPPLAIAVHPYLFALCLVPLAASAVGAVLRGGGWRAAALLMAGIAAAVALAMAFGIRPPPVSAEREWGNLSLNLMSPLWPRFCAIISMPVDVIARPGQADGRLWLGFGAVGLACLAAAACAAPGNAETLRKHRPILIAAAAAVAFAVTTRPTFGPWTLPGFYPEPLAFALEPFRASGRFAWVAAWLLVVGGSAMACRLPRGDIMVFALAMLQAYDTGPTRAEALRITGDSRPPIMARGEIAPILAAARRIELYPPYDCITSSRTHDTALEIILLASGTGTPIDSARTARRPTDCAAAAARAASPDGDTGTLRIFIDIEEPRRRESARPPAWTASCRKLSAADWGTLRVCGG